MHSESRKIKFRAWTGKQMIYQDQQYLASFIRRVVPEIIQDHGGKHYVSHESYLPNGGVIDEYLTQWTGMQDCKGRDIYEGDILRIEDATAKVVFWGRPPEYGLDPIDEDKWCDDWNLSDDSERMEVVGNIFETQVEEA